jgi:hypothetical protein
LFSHTSDPETDSEEIDFIYPLLTFDRYGEQFRWQFFQLLSFSGGPTQTENERKRFTIFPFYFQQRSSDPAENYTALFPIYGRVRNRFFRSEVFFIMFPFYGQTRKKDFVTDNYVYPFFHVRHGEKLSGWQFLPFYGRERKAVTVRTNNFNDLETIGGHDKRFIMWPFFIEETTGLGTASPRWVQASLPAYAIDRSPLRDVTTVLWPFFSRIDDRERKYREWQTPWPLVIYARGEGKHASRIFPFFSRARTSTQESVWYMWPVYKYNRVHVDPLDRHRMRILFFLYSDTVARNTESGEFERRRDFWPFFTYRHELNGNTRLQVLAPIEPVLPNNKSIERDYSPVWSLWRAENNARTGASSQSLLWNLYRRESAAEGKKCSLLFGLFQYQSDADGKRLRLFYIPLGKAR